MVSKADWVIFISPTLMTTRWLGGSTLGVATDADVLAGLTADADDSCAEDSPDMKPVEINKT